MAKIEILKGRREEGKEEGEERKESRKLKVEM